jgi:hypothetical protein
MPPLKAVLDFGAAPTAPGCARAWTRPILWEWRLAGLSDTTEVIVSELVTNSVTASLGLGRAVIRLILTLGRGEVAVLVRDDHPGAPMAAQPGAEDEDGGLLIVETLSDRCGWYPLGNGKPGKVTWAVLSEADHAAGERPGRENLGGLPDAGMAGGARSVPVLPTRPRQTPPLTTGMRAPRLVDLEILARVKVALERL